MSERERPSAGTYGVLAFPIAMLLVFFYLIAGLTTQQNRGNLTRRVLVEYLVVTGLVTAPYVRWVRGRAAGIAPVREPAAEA